MPALSSSALFQSRALIGTWTLDPGASTVALRSRTLWGLAPVKGMFGEASGTGTVLADGEVKGMLRVVAGSIDTNNARRDRHLRSADFFDSDHHPLITFEVQRIEPSGQVVRIAGTLTVRDRRVPLSFDASVAVQEGERVILDAEVRVDRAEVGLTWKGLGASMRNTLMVHAVFTRH